MYINFLDKRQVEEGEGVTGDWFKIWFKVTGVSLIVLYLEYQLPWPLPPPSVCVQHIDSYLSDVLHVPLAFKHSAHKPNRVHESRLLYLA